MTFLIMLFLILQSILTYIDYTTRYSKCDQVSDLWQRLLLAFELESHLCYTVDLRDTVEGSGLLISMLENSACFFLPV